MKTLTHTIIIAVVGALVFHNANLLAGPGPQSNGKVVSNRNVLAAHVEMRSPDPRQPATANARPKFTRIAGARSDQYFFRR